MASISKRLYAGYAFMLALFCQSVLAQTGPDSNKVIGQADLQHLHVRDSRIFYRDTFTSRRTDFTRDTFIKNIDFSGSVFKGDALFNGVMFNDYVDFTDVIFGKKANFSLLDIGDNTYFDFSRCVLPDTLDFSNNAIIKKEIDLTVAKYPDPLKKKCCINLYNSNISKFRFEYKNFSLLFTDPQDRNHVLSNDNKEILYESLLKNFKDRGQLESYELLDIEYQKFKWRRLGWLSWVGLIPEYWWNYGYNKEWIFYWVAIFLFIFTWITFLCLEHLKKEVYAMPQIPITSYNRIGERIWYSFTYSSVVFFTFGLKTELLYLKGRLGTLYVMIVFSTGIICLGYLANFILQK